MTHPDGTPDAERQPNPGSTADATVAFPEQGGAQPATQGQYGWVPAQPAPAQPAAAPAPTATPTIAVPAQPAAPDSPLYQPTVAEPTYQPTAAETPLYQPFSAPPVSGTPYGQSAPAWGQQPYPTGPAFTPPLPGSTTPRAKRGPLVPILAVLSAVLFLSTAGLGVLFAVEHGAKSRTEKTLSQRTSTLAAKSSELDRTRSDLQRANDELSRAKTDLSGSKNQADELKRQKAVISKCFTLLGELGQAAEAGDRATVTKKQAEVQTACREADRYLE
ncbi:hypothetical protein [Planosporangium mesophilum]|uniref:Uncharacterized protein n=1 Tax=Planosporangium mesophilum TaxID=689768 RepID=A0A8J3TGA7_9ACTN|nr:hypothetical protein [Planosporangium mesophilum]NJC84788.1 hypothetical protein [Planosporangium mesophilum]GII24194.1 hypothetical protein Pme01_37910 [Planosporangium mesophilum]